jgi:hypothetical protein
LPEVDDGIAQLLHLRQPQPQLVASQRQQARHVLVAACRTQRFDRLVQRQLGGGGGQQGLQAAGAGHLPHRRALQVQLQQEGAGGQGRRSLATRWQDRW